MRASSAGSWRKAPNAVPGSRPKASGRARKGATVRCSPTGSPSSTTPERRGAETTLATSKMVESLRQEVDSSRMGVASTGEVPDFRRAVPVGLKRWWKVSRAAALAPRHP